MIDWAELRLHRTGLLVNNPSFESGIAGWTPSGTSLTQTSDQQRQGLYSARLSSTGVGLTGIYCALFNVTPGETYEASGWVKSGIGSARNSYLSIAWYTSADVLISQSAGTQISTSNAEWREIKTSGVAPANAAKATVLGYVNSSAAGEVHFMDDIFCRAQSVILPDFTNLSFDTKYNDLGVIDFTYPLTKAKALGLKDQVEISAIVGFSDGTSAEVERYLIEGTTDDKVSDGERLMTLTGRSTLVTLNDAVVYPSNWKSTPVTKKARTSNVATLTLPTGHGFSQGQTVFISIGDTGFDGESKLTASTATTISYASTGSNVAAAATTGTVQAATPSGHEFVDQTAGNIFKTLIARAKARGTLQELGDSSFTGLVDSAGASWTSKHTQNYSTGTEYYSVLSEFMERGLVDAWVTSSKDFRIQNGGTRGQHIDIGTVELRPASNVSEMTTSTKSDESATTVLIEGEEGTSLERHNAQVETLLGRRKERYVQQGGIRDAGVLTLLGDAELEMYGRIPSEETVGITNTGLTPFKDFKIADWVWVRYDTDQVPVERRVRQLAFSVSESGEVSMGVTLNSILYESDVALARKIENYTGGGGSYGSTTPSVDNTVPRAPYSLSVTSGTYLDSSGNYQGAYVANWVAPTLNVDGSPLSDLDYFEVQHRYTEDSEWNFVFRTSQQETTLGYSPVTPGREIKVRVRAVDQAGHSSDWSDVVTHVLEQDTTPPPTPSTPDARDAIGYVEVEWDGKTNTSGPMPLDFSHVEVWQSPTPGFTPGVGDSTMVGAMSTAGVFVAPGGLVDQLMYYRLRSVDKAKNGTNSSLADSAKKLAVSVPEPDPPTTSPAVNVTGGIGLLHLRWEPQVSEYPIRYEIHASTINNFVPSLTTFIGEESATFSTIKSLRKNLLINGDFETDVYSLSGGEPDPNLVQEASSPVNPDAFTVSSGTLVSDTSQFYSGTRAALFTPSGSGLQYVGKPEDLPCVAGQYFRFAVRAKATTNSRQVLCRAIFRSSTNEVLATLDSPTVSTSTTEWKLATFEAQAPAGAAKVSVFFSIMDAAAGEGHHFDLWEAVGQELTEPLAFGRTYFVKVIAKVKDMLGPVGAQGSGQLKKADNEEISADYGYLGQIDANQIRSSELISDITMSGLFKTGDQPAARVEFDPAGIRLFDSGIPAPIVELPTDGAKNASFTGDLTAYGLTVLNAMELRGQDNVLAMGSKTTLQTQISGASTALSALPVWETFAKPELNGWLRDVNGVHFDSADNVTQYVNFGGGIFKAANGVFDNGYLYKFPEVRDSEDYAYSLIYPTGMAQVSIGAGKRRTVIYGDYHTPGEDHVEYAYQALVVMDTSTQSATVAPTIKTKMFTRAFNWFVNDVIGRCFSPVGSATRQNQISRVSRDKGKNRLYLFVHTISDTSITEASYVSIPDPSGGVDGLLGCAFGSSQKMGFSGANVDLWVVAIGDTAYVFNSSGVRQPQHDFPIQGTPRNFSAAGDVTWGQNSFTGFRSNTRAPENGEASIVTKYSNITWTTASDTWWAGYTWYDTNVGGRQRISTGAATAGTFTLKFNGQTTAALPYNASASAVQTALENLSNLAVGEVLVTLPDPTVNNGLGSVDGYLFVEFTGSYAGINVPLMVMTGSGLTGGTTSVTPTDSTSYESSISALTSFKMPKRASRLQVVAGDWPDFSGPDYLGQKQRSHNDPNSFRLYIAVGSDRPSNSDLWLQTDAIPTPLSREVSLTSYPVTTGVAGSDNPPTSLTPTRLFPSATAAVLLSNATNEAGQPLLSLAGDGTAHFETLDVAGEGALSLQGKAFNQLYFSVRAQSQLSGGGTKYVDGSFRIKWDARFIVIGVGRGPQLTTDGHFSIEMPPSGTVIPGYGGAANQTAASQGIPLASWCSLWYVLPYGSGTTSRPENFRITHYTSDFTVPNDWILLAQRNADGDDDVEWATKETVGAGSDSGSLKQIVLDSTSDANASAGNKPALRVGNIQGVHLRIDGNEIIAMSSNTSQSNLNLNFGGDVNLGNGTSFGSGGSGWIGNNLEVGGGLTVKAQIDAPQMTNGTGPNVTYNSGNGRLRVVGSSRRFKDNIESYEAEAAKILSLEPHEYDRNDFEPGEDTHEVGFIAEEAEALGLSEYVFRDSNGDVFSFDYSRYVVALQVVCRHLSDEIASIKQKFNEREESP